VNTVHNLVCSSRWWGRTVERELLPWGLRGVELGDDVLEFGPGFGATTRILARQAAKLSVLELEPRYCERLRRMLGEQVEVTCGDATAMPFADGRFSGVTCFTMLHHIPSRDQQDRVLGEALRVLRPGGVFAGTDSLGTGSLFRLIHVGDTLMPVDPATLPARLSACGFEDVAVETGGRSLRFRARRPG
jgi:ubiquinone/menaquinone biosynthesis C-methylase UbiE